MMSVAHMAATLIGDVGLFGQPMNGAVVIGAPGFGLLAMEASTGLGNHQRRPP